jgi:two-component system, LytTR family, response regulator
MTIRTLIIDDEPLVRTSILRVLKQDKQIDVVGECGDGPSAIEAIQGERPDLIFLDVQMPGATGLEILESLESDRLPVTIFVTAHKDYAVEAFEANAVDYILKPFGQERLKRSIARAKVRLTSSAEGVYASQLLKALTAVQREVQYHERISVPVNGRIVLVETRDIEWIEAERNCVCVYAASRTYELRTTLSTLAAKLNPRHFARIHRSTIVNLAKIKEIHPWFHGHHKVLLTNGKELRMSRYQSESVKRLLGKLEQ